MKSYLDGVREGPRSFIKGLRPDMRATWHNDRLWLLAISAKGVGFMALHGIEPLNGSMWRIVSKPEADAVEAALKDSTLLVA